MLLLRKLLGPPIDVTLHVGTWIRTFALQQPGMFPSNIPLAYYDLNVKDLLMIIT